MKKSTISKLKSIFSSKKGKRQLQQQESAKSSRSPSPAPSGEASPSDGEYRPLMRTPPPTRAGPPPSPPVPTRPVAPVAPEPSGPLPLVPCQVCGRTFLPQSLAKHAKICEKMTVKKRKTFDSSRQRREGTDLAQYLPKNFGLPENSPFLEKSPPPTAKPAPKPKVQAARSTITKANTDLQKCPHCARAFGPRAFERHVEWCADKARLLPAAPAHPPPHLADAKQRLNARTQYKAPLARGRKSSVSRDKSSHSRSASIDSSRDISPPREFGDYRHTRARASESASSNECHEEPSPHVPVIRNSRNHTTPAGDANVKARQARLARDISNSRTPKESQSTHESNTDPNTDKIETRNTTRTRLDAKKKQQLRKLEEIAAKYNEQTQNKREKPTIVKREKSLIPVPKKNKRVVDVKNNRTVDSDKVAKDIQENDSEMLLHAKTKESSLSNKNIGKNLNSKDSEVSISRTTKHKQDMLSASKPKECNRSTTAKYAKPKKKESKRIGKESSISLDSLEETAIDASSNCQSIGINTELLCVPCVIHDNIDQKQYRKSKNKSKVTELNLDKSDTKVELLYKNPIAISSCDIQSKDALCESRDSKETVDTFSSNSKHSVITEDSDSNKCILDKNEPVISARRAEENASEQNFCNEYIDVENEIDEDENKSSNEYINIENEIDEYDKNLRNKHSDEIYENVDVENEIDEDGNKSSNEYINVENEIDEYGKKLPNEHSDEICENDNIINEENVFTDLEEQNILCDTEFNENTNNIECRYGSGETYTKFTEDPADLEEFMNLTDKIILDNNYSAEVRFDIDKDMSEIHTPKTSSLEAINTDQLENDTKSMSQHPKYKYSDTFEELKSNLKELLDSAGGDENVQQCIENASDDTRKVSDMEHITVYELKLYEQKTMAEKKASLQEAMDSPVQLKLPSIDKNNKPERKYLKCTKKRMQNIYKPDRKFKMCEERNRRNDALQNLTSKQEDIDDDKQSMFSDAPPIKLPRIENTKPRLDDNNYDPFVSAARQMKELMSSDTNISKKLSNSSKDLNRTLPILRNTKEKGLTSHTQNNTKMMKDTLNKSYQKTPTLQRMKSFGSTNNDNNNSFGGRCSSFRINRNDKKSSQKLNTTFTKSSKENISTMDKSYFNRNNNLNRSFSSYSTSNTAYSTPKPRDKIPKIATSMYHSFQRTTIKQPVKLDKIQRDVEKKNFVNLDSILGDDNSSVMTDSSYIDPRLINENDNLPINVNTILNNPDIISSMESLLTTENLPAKFESFSSSNLNNNIKNRNGITNSNHKIDKHENNNNINKLTAPILDDLSTQYEKIMSSLEQSVASKTSVRDDESLCQDFDLEEFMTSFDDEIIKHKLENKRTCSSTTRIVKQSELVDSNKTSEFNSISSSPKVANGMIPVNKSMSLTFSSNNIANENLFPSSVKRSTSLLDSIQKKSVQKETRSRHKPDQLEQDLMQSLKDFDKMYASEKIETSPSNKETFKYKTLEQNGTTKRDTRSRLDRRPKKDSVGNGNYTPNGKSSNDSAYSSLNRISPSKLSVCTKESNGLPAVDQVPEAHKDEVRSVSSEEFLAMERSTELEASPHADIHSPFKDKDNLAVNEKRGNSRTSWRRGSLSSSGSEASLARTAPRLSRFCHECGTKFSVDTAKFCIECGVRRLLL